VSESYPDPLRRFLITLPILAASTMVAVDMTIANVALPHMQSTMSASTDQITWVLTSYLIAGAIATPLSGWLAQRFGRKLVLVASVAGFTAASALCGAANSLAMLVFARMLQGASGAAIIPLAQAILLDINPPEDHTKAMAQFSLGSMAGPIIGPTLGGWLTDSMSWRWVFFINIPFGILGFVTLLLFLAEHREARPNRFDMFGFAAVSIALGSFQLMIDRGERLDWFESGEIRIYATICGLSAFMALVHMLTVREPFIRPELFKDRNFTIGNVFGVLLGIAIFATVPAIVVMTQTLLGYTAFRTGMVGMPRAIGTIVAMLIVTRLANRIDTRAILMGGMAISAVSMLMYSRLSLLIDQDWLLIAGLIQGIGGGLTFVPLSVVIYTTLPRELRNEGAAMYALLRNMGNAIGISYLQSKLIHFTAISHAQLVENIQPTNLPLQYGRPDFDISSTEMLARMEGEIARQASMVGNVELYKLVFVLMIAMLPMILLMRTSAKTPPMHLPAME
jgi:MFS transporter, DHA2 family, multidrug resistance protein